MIGWPVLPFVVAAMLAAVLPRRWVRWVGLAAPLVAGAQLAMSGEQTSGALAYYGYELHVVRLDELSRPFALVFVVAAFLAGLYGFSKLTRREWVAALATVGSGLGVVLAGDLLVLFVMWELKALASAALIVGIERRRRRAAFRYLVVQVLGGSLLLAGIGWHLSTGGSLDFVAFEVSGAGWFLLTGVLISAAMPPLHAWLPDAYPNASVGGTVFLAAYTTKAAVYALLRGFAGWEVLIGLGVVMALYGVVFAMMENDLRRLLSYHIVSQVGFMVAAAGAVAEAGATGATAHAVAHILYKGTLLMGAGAVIVATGAERISDLGGLWRRMPVVFVCTLVGALSIAGVPLFSGFVSKELVIDALYGEGYSWAVLLLKLASVGTFLSVVVKFLWFTFGAEDRAPSPRPIPRTMAMALAVSAGVNLIIGMWPGPFYELMPFSVDHQPFTARKLFDTVQLLSLAGIAAMLLISRMRPSPGITLDTDWSYRSGARLVAVRLRSLRARVDVGPALDLRLIGRALPARLRLTGRSAESTASTASMGAAVCAVVLVVIVVSVVG